ncbi:MAG: GGDEF domain-containing protein [Gemmatimonadota bacterium]
MEFSLIFIFPASLAAIAAGLLFLYQRARQRGFREGVASAQVDPATRLVSRAMADHLLNVEFAAAERGRPLTIVLFSIDNFRRLAAMEGGRTRDRLLLSVGAVLRRRTRGMHVSARLGDDGVFLSILGGAESRGASTFVGRVQRDLGTIAVGSHPLLVSASVCPYRPEMRAVEELLADAHGSLAEARAKGGNQVVVSGEI